MSGFRKEPSGFTRGSLPPSALHPLKVGYADGRKRLKKFGPRVTRHGIPVPPDSDGAGLASSGLGHGCIPPQAVDESTCVVSHALSITSGNIIEQEEVLRDVIFASVGFDPMETQWATLTEPHERLRWARLKSGFSTIRSGAEALGVHENTYAQYEREPGASRSATLDHQLAIRAGRKYRVSWTWLLVGEGTPFDRPSNQHQQRAIQAMAQVPEDRQAALADALEALVRSA